MADLPKPETRDEDEPTTASGAYVLVEDEWSTETFPWVVVELPPLVLEPGPPPVRPKR